MSASKWGFKRQRHLQRLHEFRVAAFERSKSREIPNRGLLERRGHLVQGKALSGLRRGQHLENLGGWCLPRAVEIAFGGEPEESHLRPQAPTRASSCSASPSYGAVQKIALSSISARWRDRERATATSAAADRRLHQPLLQGAPPPHGRS